MAVFVVFFTILVVLDATQTGGSTPGDLVSVLVAAMLLVDFCATIFYTIKLYKWIKEQSEKENKSALMEKVQRKNKIVMTLIALVLCLFVLIIAFNIGGSDPWIRFGTIPSNLTSRP